MTVENVIIIGAGPAGVAAGVQLKRYGLDPIIFEKERVGGLLKNANLVENYPGFAEGISGPDLVERISAHANALALRIRFEKVCELDRDDAGFRVVTTAGAFQARVVVVASGTRPIEFVGCQIPQELKDRVFYEVFPIRQTAGKTVAILGAGDAAYDYALNLADKNDLIILNRNDQIKALPLLVERANACSRIRYMENIQFLGITPGGGDSFRLQYESAGKHQWLETDYLIFAIGREPELDFVAAGLKSVAGETDGLYFCGDVVNGQFRQTAIAVGDGIRVAMTIYQQLEER